MDSTSSSMQALTSHTAPVLASVLQPCLEGITSDWLLLGMKTPAEVLIVTTEWEVCVMMICPSRITLKPPNSFHSSCPGAIQGWPFSFIPRPSKISSRNRYCLLFLKQSFALVLHRLAFPFGGVVWHCLMNLLCESANFLPEALPTQGTKLGGKLTHR